MELLRNIHIINLEEQTPIEIALGIDEEGRTTARKLYEFLELAKGQFSRWSKANIVENSFAEEEVDYWGFDIDVEGNKTKDYKLTASFAKKLAMCSHTPRGEQARNYFVKVEDILREKALTEKQKLPSTYKDALKQLLLQVEENERLETEKLEIEKDKNRLEVELDYSKQWYTVKRVAAINNVSWKTIDWKKLKAKSYELGYEIQKIFDANYGHVNSYHYRVWRAVYPQYKI